MRTLLALLVLPAMAAAQNVTVYTYPNGQRVAVWDDLSPVRITTSRPVVATGPAPPPVVLPALPPAPIVYNVPPTYAQPMPARRARGWSGDAEHECPVCGELQTVVYQMGPTSHSHQCRNGHVWSHANPGSAPTYAPTYYAPPPVRYEAPRPLIGVGAGIYGPFGGGVRAEACVGGRP